MDQLKTCGSFLGAFTVGESLGGSETTLPDYDLKERPVAEVGKMDWRGRERVEDRVLDPDAESAGGGDEGTIAGADEGEKDNIMSVDDLQSPSHGSSPARPLSPEGAALSPRRLLPVNL